MIRRIEAAKIADAMLERTALYKHRITWALLREDVPAGMMLDRDKHSAWGGFDALNAGRDSLISYLRRVVCRIAR